MVTVHHTSPHRDKHIVKIVRELVHRGNGSSDVVRRAPQEHTHTHISVVTVTAHHTSPQRDNHIAKIVRELVHRGNCCSDVLPRS